MAARVQEHISERIADFTRRLRTRAWNRSARTGPRRRNVRFSARAMRAPTAIMPRPSAAASVASTGRCEWVVRGARR